MDHVSWTPVDMLSRILLELIHGDLGHDKIWTKYYHLDNPQISKWFLLVPTLQKYFASSEKTVQSIVEETHEPNLKVISYEDWIQKLEESGKAKDTDLPKNPALKLLAFYQALSRGKDRLAELGTIETSKRSETMRKLKAVDANWMRLWLDQWNS